ncbi:hypothetical protein CEQ90_13405 [Lewinellaceae bacterium SD302]|nr:hypothetical protein CEQ90_13405 [Lewinellaceae bacterium SD302]
MELVSIMRLPILLGLLCLPLILAAQQHRDITYDAQLSKQKMLLNSTVEYSVNLRNSRGEDFQPPDFKGFVVLSGPGRTMGTTVINGVATSYQSYKWLLQPQRTGRITIGPSSIRAQGRTYRSNSQTVEVLPVDTKLAAMAPENFLRMEFSKDTAYVGEQLIMDLVLYTSDNAISRNLVAEPDLNGFFAFPRRQFDGRTRNLLENGKEYAVRTIASVALYPLKSGELVIEPYRLLLGVVKFRNPQSTFSRRFTERIPLQTDTTRLFVSELPAPRPASFSGGVGTFRLDAEIDRNKLSTDEAITLRLDIAGQGDVKRISAEAPVDPKDWVIYEPEVLKEEFYDSPTGMYGQKIVEYKIVPKRAGNYSLQPLVSYFNPDSSRYLTLTDDEYLVEVSQGSAVVNYDVEEDSLEAEEVLSLRPAGPVGRLKNYGDHSLNPLFGWSLTLFPILLFGGYFFYDRRRKALENVDPEELARQRARRAAEAHLKIAKTELDRGGTTAFYNAIEDALLGYLRDKFKLPVAELSKRNIHQVLITKGAPLTLADGYVDLLRRCEMALYAGGGGKDAPTKTYQEATDLILSTEAAVTV